MVRETVFLRHDGLIWTRAEGDIWLEVRLNAERQRLSAPIERGSRRWLLCQGRCNGTEYQRAIQLYYRKLGRYPPSIEALENTNNIRFLRRRYKDPLTGEDAWRIVHMGPAGPIDSLVNPLKTGVGQDGQPFGQNATNQDGFGQSGFGQNQSSSANQQNSPANAPAI